MGFLDKPVESSLDRLFDFNRDGVLDIGEQGAQLDFILEDIEDDYDDEEPDDLDDFEDLDMDELEEMDEDERREALEDAGYDPDDFDDLF